MQKTIAGIDIGGTKIAVGVATPDCRLIGHESFPTSVADGPQVILRRTVEALAGLLGRHGAVAERIGIGCAGPLDAVRGVTLSPPNLPGWEEFPVAAFVGDRIGVPVVFDNDANAAALAEHKFGAGRGCDSMIYLTVSTGIGGGIVLDGKLVRGRTGNAGELGHLVVWPDGPQCGCGARGCLEAVASGTAIANRFAELSSEIGKGTGGTVSAGDVIGLAADGNVAAARVWDDAIDCLAIGLSNVIVTFDPEAVVIGGGVSLAGDRLFGPLRERLAGKVRIFEARKVKILPAGLGAMSGVYGALALAAD